MSGPLSHQLDGRLQQMVEDLTRKKGIHHALFAIETGDRSYQQQFVSGAATPDGLPMRAETPFFVASISKLFIAVSTLQLVEQGQISLGAPIVDYLPNSVVSGLHRIDGRDYSDCLTVEHLLRHTSGLPDWLEDRGSASPPLMDRLFTGQDHRFDIVTIASLVREELTPHFPPQDPGASEPLMRYADTNYQLLIAIIESVSGVPLPDVYLTRIFAPLGLRKTWLPERLPAKPGGQEPATVWSGDHPLRLPLVFASLRDLYSTAADLIHFMRALIAGSLFENPGTAGIMYGRFRRFTRFPDPSALRLPQSPIEYGAGIMRLPLPRLATPGRPTPDLVGHTGATGTWLFYCREFDLYLCGCVDQTAAAPLPFRFVAHVLRAITQ